MSINYTRLTHLSTDVYVHTGESFMADETTLSLELTTFLNHSHPAVTKEQSGILSRGSYHITIEEAERLVEKLKEALAEVTATEVA
jgi:hypothetical protein